MDEIRESIKSSRKFRVREMICENCIFYVLADDRDNEGVCRGSVPQPSTLYVKPGTIQLPSTFFQWPRVKQDWFCRGWTSHTGIPFVELLRNPLVAEVEVEP